ncbi:MAG: hypothetical protein K5981_05170 [Clostridia bacterium]|nr:hypothetical protein [Clostridia bacterium]
MNVYTKAYYDEHIKPDLDGLRDSCRSVKRQTRDGREIDGWKAFNKTLDDTLDRYAQSWREMDAAGCPDAAGALLIVWKLAEDFFAERFIAGRLSRLMHSAPKQFREKLEDAAVNELLNGIMTYDPAKGSLSAHLSFLVPRRLNDVGLPDEIEVEEWESSAPLEDHPLRSQEDPEYRLLVKEAAEDLLMGREYRVLGMTESLSRTKSAEAARLDWYRLFYTEFVTVNAQAYGIADIFSERRLFAALQKDYLDHYMEASPCGSLLQMVSNTLRPLGDISWCPAEKAGKRLYFEDANARFPAGISLRWLGLQRSPEDHRRKSGESERSRMRKRFEEQCSLFRSETMQLPQKERDPWKKP